MFEEILREERAAAGHALPLDDDLRVVLLTASGRTFSAGSDIKELRELARQIWRLDIPPSP